MMCVRFISSVPEWLMTSVPCASLALFSVVPLKWRNDLKYLKLEAITHLLNVWEDELSGCDSIHTFPVLRIATQPCAFAWMAHTKLIAMIAIQVVTLMLQLLV